LRLAETRRHTICETFVHTMCDGMTRNPMRLTGTKTALSADTRSIDRLGDRRVMRAFNPGCPFQQQSGTRQPD